MHNLQFLEPVNYASNPIKLPSSLEERSLLFSFLFFFDRVSSAFSRKNVVNAIEQGPLAIPKPFRTNCTVTRSSPIILGRESTIRQLSFRSFLREERFERKIQQRSFELVRGFLETMEINERE